MMNNTYCRGRMWNRGCDNVVSNLNCWWDAWGAYVYASCGADYMRRQETKAYFDKILEINPMLAEGERDMLIKLGRFHEAMLPLQNSIKFAPSQYANRFKKAGECFKISSG